jgi:hypothetical protein
MEEEEEEEEKEEKEEEEEEDSVNQGPSVHGLQTEGAKRRPRGLRAARSAREGVGREPAGQGVEDAVAFLH